MPTDWSDAIRVADLSDEPEFSEELANLTSQIQAKHGKHAVLDLSGVSYLNSSHIAQLLRLRRELTEQERKLHLCGVRDPVWSVMLITGLDKVFDFFENKATAITALQINDANP
ncbi:MAG: STAS domain-containing protein [Phycisphaerales bacterium]|nr:STAS domain-containing protein [Phycisphaerales bacterium]